jgi:hypothetical protein
MPKYRPKLYRIVCVVQFLSLRTEKREVPQSQCISTQPSKVQIIKPELHDSQLLKRSVDPESDVHHLPCQTKLICYVWRLHCFSSIAPLWKPVQVS